MILSDFSDKSFDDVNWILFMFELVERLASLAGQIWSFMFNEIGIGDYDISMWQFLGGGGVAAVLIYSIVRG